MEFLQSNFAPLKTNCSNFASKFDELLFLSDKVQIASGFITADSVADLHRTIQLNSKPNIELVIGMHYFDGFTKKEYQAAIAFNNYLSKENIGGVFLSTAFKYHGKVYSFLKNNECIASIIGSNNLGSITEYSRIYETSLLLTEKKENNELKAFINNLIQISKPINQCKIEKFKEYNKLLFEHDGVESINPLDVPSLSLPKTEFKIPLKAGSSHSKSNLNVFFGKGREDKRGLIKPRHWYEIELIVPSEITSKKGYPSIESGNNIFDVITDDGWTFKCKVSGDYSKNFRSEGDLKILGKWIKGRLENAGALNVGELVTEDTLKKYGRSDFDLVKTAKENVWFLNFGI